MTPAEYDAAEREMDLYRDEITRLRAAHEAEIASLAGQRNRVSETADQLRDGIRQLLADVTKSADATRPSKKTAIEDDLAARLRDLLGDEDS